MDENTQIIFNIALAIAGTLFGWKLKEISDSIKSLREADGKLADKVSSLQVLVAGEYIKREELREFARIIIAKLDAIEKKVDGKEDKGTPHG